MCTRRHVQRCIGNGVRLVSGNNVACSEAVRDEVIGNHDTVTDIRNCQHLYIRAGKGQVARGRQ